MTDIHTLSPEHLSTHAAALRRLARQLVRCPDAAEDALQETWARALASPPQSLSRLGAWLRTVLHNVVASQQRTEIRRRTRERSRADDESATESSPLDTVSRHESLQRITAAIGSLSEADQTIVFLRYFDELPPRKIAARLGVSPQFVYRRLGFAHARLRKKLREDWRDRGGDWRAGLLGLFGTRASQSVPLTWKEIAIVTLNTKLLLSVGLLVAIALPILLLARGETPAPAVGSEPPRTDVAGYASGHLGSDRRVAREPVPTDDVSQFATVRDQEAYEFELNVIVSDPHDMLLADHRVVLGPSLHELNVAGETDDAGRLAIRWRGRRSAMDVVVLTSESSPRLRRLRVEAGAPASIALRSETAAHVSTIPTGARVHVRPMLWDVRAAGGQRAFPRMRDDGDGFQRFVTGHPVSTRDGSAQTEARRWIVAHQYLTADEGPAESRGSIAMTVHDALGRPVPGAHVVARSASSAVKNVAETDANGFLQFDDLPAGAWTLRAGGGNHGIARAEVVCVAGEVATWNPRLDRGHELLGRLVSESGRPLANWTVRASSETPTSAWIDETQTDERGRFAIPNAPDREHRLDVLLPSVEAQPSTALFAAHVPWSVLTARAWPTRAPVDVVIPSLHFGAGEVRIRWSGEPAQTASLDARLWSQTTGIGLRVPITDGELSLALPAGEHRLTAGGPTTEWSETARFHVTASGTIELGTAALTAPGHVALPPCFDGTIARVGPQVISHVDRTPARPVAPSGSNEIGWTYEAPSAVVASLFETWPERPASLGPSTPSAQAFTPGDYLAILPNGDIVPFHVSAGEVADPVLEDSR